MIGRTLQGNRLVRVWSVSALSLCTLCTACATVEKDDEWVYRGAVDGWQDCIAVPSEDVHEVVVSRSSEAISALWEQNFLRIDPAMAAGVSGHDFQSGPDQEILLVRAVAASGAGGRFEVKWCQGDLIVTHTSLGNASVVKTAVLIRTKLSVKQSMARIEAAY